MKQIFHFFNSRIGKTLFIVLSELLWIIILAFAFREYIGWLEAILRLISVFIVLGIMIGSRHLSSDLMYVVLILFAPVVGTVMFLFLNVMEKKSSRTYRRIVEETDRAKKFYVQDPKVLKEVEEADPARAGQFDYLVHSGGFPVYENTGFDYYKVGEEGFPVMLEEMRKAKEFIFLEYFIIEPGKMWDAMHEILVQKAKEGVLCRVIYDDMGSMGTVPYSYADTLEKEGIHAQAFNRVSPLINGIMNHRDHRKILVIDGKVAFSGGINLADEYINEKMLYGHWKDNCFRVKGEAVYSFTVLFLTTWNALRPEDEDYTVYKREPLPGEKDGYIIPYGETPLDNNLIGEGVYINILNQAREYCYIYTPYLIIDEDLMNALILCAQRGVDVRIMTPGVPDKKIIWYITKSYYFNLMRGGVKIYEYTPGFDHAKVFVCDDMVATVGTLNLDYRSLYLHFENGTYIYGAKEIPEIRMDFLESVQKSHYVVPDDHRLHPVRDTLFAFVRIFAPLM